MNDKIEVIVFGIHDCPPSTACDCCSGGCIGFTRPLHKNLTMGKLFDDLIIYINGKKDCDKIELKFIDVIKDDINEYNDVKRLLNDQFKLPYTKIDGHLKYYGSLSKEFIYKDVEKILSNTSNKK